jgi:hypothetical protein
MTKITKTARAIALVAGLGIAVPGAAGAQDEHDQQGQDGMMGPGMMEHGMMDPGMGRETMGHAMGMRVMMILMDTDGDGALSLEEVQAAHARIFKVIDADKDGKVTLAEIEMFFRGGSSTSHQ